MDAGGAAFESPQVGTVVAGAQELGTSQHGSDGAPGDPEAAEEELGPNEGSGSGRWF